MQGHHAIYNASIVGGVRLSKFCFLVTPIDQFLIILGRCVAAGITGIITNQMQHCPT